jgi:hypothetical protein
MKYTTEMDSSAMIYILRFIKTGSAIQKFIGGDIQTQMHRQRGNRISLLLFSQNNGDHINLLLFFIFKIRKVG